MGCKAGGGRKVARSSRSIRGRSLRWRCRRCTIREPADCGTLIPSFLSHVVGLTPAHRVNFTSRGLNPSTTELQTTLKRYADLARPLGWVVQLYTPLRSVEALAELLEGNVLG